MKEMKSVYSLMRRGESISGMKFLAQMRINLETLSDTNILFVIKDWLKKFSARAPKYKRSISGARTISSNCIPVPIQAYQGVPQLA